MNISKLTKKKILISVFSAAILSVMALFAVVLFLRVLAAQLGGR